MVYGLGNLMELAINGYDAGSNPAHQMPNLKRSFSSIESAARPPIFVKRVRPARFTV